MGEIVVPIPVALADVEALRSALEHRVRYLDWVVKLKHTTTEEKDETIREVKACRRILEAL